MPCYSPPAAGVNFKTVLDSFAAAPGLPFQEVLTADHIERLAAEEQVHFGAAPGSIYTVAVTLWAFVAQVLSKEKACVAAVARVSMSAARFGPETAAHIKQMTAYPLERDLLTGKLRVPLFTVPHGSASLPPEATRLQGRHGAGDVDDLAVSQVSM